MYRRGSVGMPSLYIPETPQISLSSIGEWWQSVLKEQGKYKCYAILLFLPADRHILKYLDRQAYLQELDLISDKNCLVIISTKEYIKRVGKDKQPVKVWIDKETVKERGFAKVQGPRNIYDEVIEPSPTEFQGYCRVFARIFKITYDQFPCLVLFQNIDSPKHIIVSLQNLEPEKISLRMRNIFTVVENAVMQKKDPLQAIRNYLLKYKILSKKAIAVNDIREFAGISLGYAMQAWINSLFRTG